MNQQAQIEAYLQQLKQMGMTDEMIELYRQQMNASMQYVSQWTKQLSQLNMQPGQFFQQAAHAASFAGAAYKAGNNSLKLAAQSTLTPAQQWAVACGANLAYANGQYLNELSTGLEKRTCRDLLSEWWDIDSGEELDEMIAWLQEEGHRFQFDTIWQAISTVSMKESKQFLKEYVASNPQEEEVVLQRLRNMRDALEAFSEDGLLEQGNAVPDMMIWDYARLINLCRAGFDAGYIERKNALQRIEQAAAEIAQHYRSWKELSVAYLFARYVWGGNSNDEYLEFKEGMSVLLNDAQSPWVTLPWN